MSHENIKSEPSSYDFNAIEIAIKSGIEKTRESIKPLGATIPHDTISVIIRDGGGNLKAIRTIQN